MQVGVNVTCMYTSFGWVWSLQFRRYGYLSKMANFPFRPMDYSPWSSKNSIDRNRLKKFMQVGIDVKCMHTDFGGRGLSSFGDKISLWSIKVEKSNRSESAQKIHASRDRCHVHSRQFWWAWLLRFQRYGYFSKTAKFPFRPMDYSPWSSKNSIDRNRLKKFMQVEVDVTCMHTNFDGWSLSSFGDKISLWSIKVEKFNQSKSAKKIMQAGVNVMCMYISFGGCGFSGFRDIATFQKRPNFPFGAWTIVHGHQKI